MKGQIAILSVLGLCYLCTPLNVSAQNAETAIQNEVESEIQPYAAGLIKSYYLSCSSGTDTIYISGRTSATDVMAEVGFKGIKIQRSSDGKSWSTEKTVGDKLTESTTTHSLSNYAVSVQGGYYYRVICTHYAKESGWFFPDTQSVENTSSYVWIA